MWMSPAAAQGIAGKQCRGKKVEKIDGSTVLCPRISRQKARGQDTSAAMSSENPKNLEQKRPLHLASVGKVRDKIAFLLSLAKAIQLLQSASSEAFQLLLLCINPHQNILRITEELGRTTRRHLPRSFMQPCGNF